MLDVSREEIQRHALILRKTSVGRKQLVVR